MAPTFKHGKGAFFSASNASAAVINLSSGVDDVTWSRSLDTAEVTTYGDNDRNYIVGLRGATVSVSGHFSSTHAKQLDAMLGHSTFANLVFGPEGTAAGSRKFTAASIMTSLEYAGPVDDKVSASFDFIISGAVTSTNY